MFLKYLHLHLKHILIHFKNIGGKHYFISKQCIKNITNIIIKISKNMFYNIFQIMCLLLGINEILTNSWC